MDNIHSSSVSDSAGSKEDSGEKEDRNSQNNVLLQTFRIRSSDVTIHRTLRVSALLKYLQEAAVRHTTQLGMGRDKTLDRGLLWVITQQQVSVLRLPGYDEEITIATRPGRQLHLFFPRYTSVYGEDGTEMVRSRALWILIDEHTRKPVFPKPYGIHIEGSSKTGDFPLPRVKGPRMTFHDIGPDTSPRNTESFHAGKNDTGSLSDVSSAARRTISSPGADTLLLSQECSALYSECDINGHMNNSAYFDLFDDLVRAVPCRRPSQYPREGFPKDIAAEYDEEIPFGSRYTAQIFRSGKGYLFQGIKENRILFRIQLT